MSEKMEKLNSFETIMQKTEAVAEMKLIINKFEFSNASAVGQPCILPIYCRKIDDDTSFGVTVDTTSCPYPVTSFNNNYTMENIEFRDELVEYLEKVYPHLFQ